MDKTMKRLNLLRGVWIPFDNGSRPFFPYDRADTEDAIKPYQTTYDKEFYGIRGRPKSAIRWVNEAIFTSIAGLSTHFPVSFINSLYSYIASSIHNFFLFRPQTSNGYRVPYDLNEPIGGTTYDKEYCQKPQEPCDSLPTGSNFSLCFVDTVQWSIVTALQLLLRYSFAFPVTRFIPRHGDWSKTE